MLREAPAADPQGQHCPLGYGPARARGIVELARWLDVGLQKVQRLSQLGRVDVSVLTLQHGGFENDKALLKWSSELQGWIVRIVTTAVCNLDPVGCNSRPQLGGASYEKTDGRRKAHDVFAVCNACGDAHPTGISINLEGPVKTNLCRGQSRKTPSFPSRHVEAG
jgi:hypothetical protein